jgi:hypothetical protein
VTEIRITIEGAFRGWTMQFSMLEYFMVAN